MELNKYIDHTNLKPTATDADIEKLCEEAKKYGFASVCINPCRVGMAARILKDSDVKVCTVIGFPLGAETTEMKAISAKRALGDGCDEFDMVINLGALKSGNDAYVLDDIRAVVNAVEGKTVKVIIETFYLNDEEIERACRISEEAGAHFVKTCTGFNDGKAEPEHVALMRKTVSDKVKVKASGGVRTRERALEMIAAGADRIGTSSGVTIISGN